MSSHRLGLSRSERQTMALWVFALAAFPDKFGDANARPGGSHARMIRTDRTRGRRRFSKQPPANRDDRRLIGNCQARVIDRHTQPGQCMVPRHCVGQADINRIMMLRTKLLDQRFISFRKSHINPPTGVGELVGQNCRAQHMPFARSRGQKDAVAAVPD